MASPHESSQSVLSIQELAKKSLTSLPQYCYMVRDNHERGAIAETFCPAIPTIDLKKLIHGETTEIEQENLHLACRDWGFFQVLAQLVKEARRLGPVFDSWNRCEDAVGGRYINSLLVNYGVSPVVLNKLKEEIEAFYKLPLEEMMKYKPKPGDVEGYGAVIRADKKLDWGDKLYIITNPVHRRQPHLFPQLPSALRTIFELYVVELENIAITLLGFVGKEMKIEKREMEELFRDGMQAMRMTYYPPCSQPELVMGLSAHSDACGITILNQVNGVDALQIKKDGVWIPIKVTQDALIVNIGDVVEIMSNGLYKSVDHRATVNLDKERFSLAWFFNPKYECEIGPSVNLISPENPPLYKRVGMEKYLKEFFSRNKVDGKSYLEQMKIPNENAPNDAA